MIINLEEIKNLIPHRNPFLFVDKCKIIEPGKKGLSERFFSKDEYFFEGHFPGNPIVPGVIIVEAMAQTAGIVVSHQFRDIKDKSVLFMSVNKAKFRKPILPNQNISFEVNYLNKVKDVYKFQGSAFYESTRVAETEFTAMITIGKK
ncbi:3-hydroxyacyl-ACP dehydratase FabZ [Pelagibacterales bacterium SAG-MED31]|nr:3-hydroxyacyl-ACP dehydratase FabZ [Pelagibacterales bacterium SAG-MED31]